MNDPNPIHRATTEVHKVRSRATRGVPDKEAPTGDKALASDATVLGGGARSEAKSAESSEAHKARGGSGNDEVVRSGSTPDLTTRTQQQRLLNVGYGNLIAARRVVAIVAPNASPMRRLRHEAAERGKLVDATEGRRTRSIVILDSDHVVLSAINPETLAARLVEDDAGPHA